MTETVGSQYLGVWYDIIGWGVSAAIFFAFATSVDKPGNKYAENLPKFMKNKKFLYCVSGAFAIASLVKFFTK